MTTAPPRRPLDRAARSGRARTRSVRSVLDGPAGTLADLVSVTRRLARIDAALAEVLDPAVHGHVRAGGCEAGTLTLVADSPAWATRLRYLAPMLREQLAGRLDGGLARVQIVARPVSPERPAPRPERRAANLSEDTARMLESIANGIADPALSESVRRVARHGRRRR